MALIGDTNFSLNPDVNMAAIASLYQKQATDQQNMALQQSQMADQAQQRIMNVMDMATKMTQNMITNSQNKMMANGRNAVQTMLGTANTPVVSNPDQPTPSGQMTPAATNPALGLPPMPQGATTSATIPMSQTPDYQAQLRQAIAKGYPQQSGEALAQQQFPKPVLPQTQIIQVQNPDGTTGYASVDKTHPTAPPIPIPAAQVPKATAQQRQAQIDAQTARGAGYQQMANARTAQTLLGSINTGPGAIEQNKIDQGNHIRAMIDQYTDPKTGNLNIPVTLYPELATGLARMVSPNGVVGVESQKQFQQATTKGNLASLYVRLTGDTSTDLSNASTQSVLKLYRDAIDRQGSKAQDNRDTIYKNAQGLLNLPKDTSNLLQYQNYTNQPTIGGGSPTSGLQLPTAEEIAAELAGRK